MPGPSRNRSPVRGPSKTEAGTPETASARDPGSCVTCRPGKCRLGAGIDTGRHHQGSWPFSLHVNDPAGRQSLPCQHGRWPLGSLDQRPASTPHTWVTWAGACLSLHPHMPEQSGKSDLVLLTTWRQGGLGPGFCGPGRGPPCPASPGGRGGRPGQWGRGGGAGWVFPTAPRGTSRARGVSDKQGAEGHRSAVTTLPPATAGPPSLPQLEEEGLKEVKGPEGAGPDHGDLLITPQMARPLRGSTPHMTTRALFGPRTGRHSARLEPLGRGSTEPLMNGD